MAPDRVMGMSDRIQTLRDKITKAERDIAVAEDRVKTAQEQLRKEFGCRDEAEARKKLEAMEREMGTLEAQITREQDKLEAEVSKWT